MISTTFPVWVTLLIGAFPALHHLLPCTIIPILLKYTVLLKGKRNCFVDNKSYTVTGNELFITFPFETHSSGNYYQSPSSFYGIQIDLKSNRELLGLNKEYSKAIHNILTNLPHRHLRVTTEVVQMLKLAFENISDGNEHAKFLGVQHLCCFLFTIPDLIPIKQQAPKKLDSHIKQVLDYIESHYIEDIKLKELAVLAGYSLSQFKIKFKEEVGITPANYVTFRKLDFAQKLLVSTQKPVTQIALDAGFSSSNYFCTVLKKFTNHTPSDIRQRFSLSK